MKKKIALVTGGYQDEAQISYLSAENMAQNIDAEKYDAYLIDITKNGWFYTDKQGVKQTVNKEDFSIREGGETIRFDVALMCIHGSPGEDGKLLGYFDMLGLPYTTCNAAVSALTFNKRFTVVAAAFAGIDVAKSVLINKGEPICFDEIKALKFPVFVKGNNGGSSIGMTKLLEQNKNDKDLETAINKAFEEGKDEQVIVEEGISGREFTISVFRDTTGEIVALPMSEVILKEGRATFDFEAKYNGETTEVTPAKVSDDVAEKISAAAKKLYRELNCGGVVRIDFIYNEEVGRPFMLEVNSVPGETKESFIPQQVAAKGWTLKDFYSKLIEASLKH